MRVLTGLIIIIFCSILLVFFSSGCNSIHTLTPSPSTTQVYLTPFIIASEENTIDELKISPTLKLTFTPTLSLSPTPFTYSIEKGDTFTSIAFFHGVKLNDLIAANPDVDPNFLTVGMTITIPISQTNSIPQLNPTPIPLKYEGPVCYQNQVGGLWCIAEVVNSQPFDIENLSAIFTISSSSQIDEISQIVYSPINVLLPDSKIPLMAYFEPPIPRQYETQVDILSVLPSSSETNRYLKPIIQNQDIEISENSTKAIISGEIKIPGDKIATRIWIVAVAYSKNGDPVGIRKWETSIPLPVGEKRSFRIYLYSLGPQISNVNINIEAQP